ncbi:MAG: sugar ABC transporter permease [Ruminococcaceae bacterium]|nr:sugar ABC transporter permease [Oscillospiraceae bacterium]
MKAETTYIKDDRAVKLTYLIMGWGSFAYGQRAKGVLFFAAEAAYIIYMLTAGIPALKGFITLGTREQGWVYDPQLGINVQQSGDNSMLLLLYGVVAIIITVLTVLLYLSSLRSAREAQRMTAEGRRLPSFAEELRSMLDSRLHITLLILPVAGVLIFTVLPLIYMILIAFTNYDSNHQPPGKLFDWVGFQNFSAMLLQRSTLSRSFFPILLWTMIWAVLATASNYIVGIALAVLINRKGIRFKAFWRTILILTIAVPQFISLLIMRNMLSNYGAINELLLSLGWISKRIEFLSNPLLAKVSVLLVNMWIGIPYTMLISTGILMNIPEEQYEAARVDGASPLMIFRKITMPQILFVTTPYLITQFIGNINNFNVIYLLTDGGPQNSSYYFAGSTDLLVTWLYKLTANHRDYSIASTIGILVFLLSAVFSLLSYSRSKAFREEEGYQ